MSKVFFCDFKTSLKRNLFDKINLLINKIGFQNIIAENDLVAIKIHFGEDGNTAYINPTFVKPFSEKIKELGGRPFLTDTNTLYIGERSNAISHLNLAEKHGFIPAVTGAPVLIADGLMGEAKEYVKINGQHLKEVPIGQKIVHATALLSLAHFKGHELTGFGGALKNIGMGCASREGKLTQHSTSKPLINQTQCSGCGSCVEICQIFQAITIKNKKARIDSQKCSGCVNCMVICPKKAIYFKWNAGPSMVQEKMIEFFAGVVQNKKGKCIYVNFINNVTPLCDCYGHNDLPIVEDIGILISRDPVAIDKASVDLVNKEPGNKKSSLKKALRAGEDKFRALFPKVDWQVQFNYAEKLGLGNQAYELVKIN